MTDKQATRWPAVGVVAGETNLCRFHSRADLAEVRLKLAGRKNPEARLKRPFIQRVSLYQIDLHFIGRHMAEGDLAKARAAFAVTVNIIRKLLGTTSVSKLLIQQQSAEYACGNCGEAPPLKLLRGCLVHKFSPISVRVVSRRTEERWLNLVRRQQQPCAEA